MVFIAGPIKFKNPDVKFQQYLATKLSFQGWLVWFFHPPSPSPHSQPPNGQVALQLADPFPPQEGKIICDSGNFTPELFTEQFHLNHDGQDA